MSSPPTKDSEPHLPKRKAFLFIFLPACLILSGFFYLFFGDIFEKGTGKNHLVPLSFIVQGGPQANELKSVLLAEVMNLAQDKPVDFRDFDLTLAKKKLLETHVLSEVHLKKIKPSSLYIEYTLREPIGVLGDLANTLFDENGVLFPSFPFYTPKKLPDITFGALSLPLSNKVWGEKVQEKKLKLARELLEEFKSFTILSIDFSRLDALLLGQQEIVMIVKEDKGYRVLRLAPSNYELQIKNYFSLENTYLSRETGSFIVDLRISNVAYLKALAR